MPTDEEIIEELEEALHIGEIAGGVVGGAILWAVLGRAVGGWEAGAIAFLIHRQHKVLRVHGIDPRSEKGQELLAKSREGTVGYKYIRMPKIFVKSD